MANSSPDYKALFEEERIRRQLAEERTQPTTFLEFLRCCHNSLSRPLKVEISSRSTAGKIPLPTGKYCPKRLERWVDFASQQQAIFKSVCRHLQAEENTLRLFSPRLALEELGKHFKQPLSSEQNLESYERFAVEDHVHAIISELCQIPAAREEFGLGDGVWFGNHTNVLNPSENVEPDTEFLSKTPHGRPDQFFIHRVDGNTNTLLTTVEYKPPHKLSVENLRMGLSDMDVWKRMVKANKVFNDERPMYNAQRLVCSAIVQEYHVMIQEGLEYSYLTTGVALVLLRVPYGQPSTLYYHFCEPNQEMDEDEDLEQPKTSIARVLCLCLMSSRSRLRDQEWRNAYCSDIPTWTTNFYHTLENIPKEELQQNPPSDSTEYRSPESDPTSSEYQGSSPIESSSAPTRQIPTRSQGSCAPHKPGNHSGSPGSSGSESDQGVSGRKRGFSQVELSPSQRLPRQDTNDRQNESHHQKETERQNDLDQRRNAQFCTQRCLLGLQHGGPLDDCCPNVNLHRQSGGIQHSITAGGLVSLLKEQMDEDIDRCIPFGSCGSYGAPFKLTCAIYGYTVVGKGTTSALWRKVVSHEAEIYHILRKAQGSAVPVFLGMIDLAKIYFLHGAGQIRHMLVMGWAGESMASLEQTSELRKEIRRSKREIRALGVRHLDLRLDNILWNAELQRALIIDFHRSELDRRPTADRSRSLKRSRHGTEMPESKRVRAA